MILVLLGTHELQFHRLLEEVEKCIDMGIISEEVIVQAGNTKFKTDKMEILDYLSYNQLDDLIKNAQFIICHGGTGSIISSVRNRKKVIVVPRLKKYNEHNDDHQMEIIKILKEKGYIEVCLENDCLGEVISRIDEFTPIPYSDNNALMINTIKDFINQN